MAEKESTLMPTSTAISASSTKHVFLHEWWLVNAKGKGGGGSGGLAVGGFAHRDTQRVSLFCSAPISKRLNATMVLARDGIAVSLNGLINSRHTTSNGFSTEVCDKFMLGFPYDWDDYATCHAHQSCGAQANVPHSSSMEKNVCQTTLENVPVTSIRAMLKISDLNSLMDDTLSKVGNPAEKDEPRTKFVAKRCLKASPVIDRPGRYNHDSNADDNMVTPSPSKKEPNTHCRWEEAVCSTNRTGISTRREKRCLKASLVEGVAGYKYNLHNADVEVETALSKQQTRCSPLEAVNCHIQIANPVSSKNSVLKASFRKDMAGEDQDQLGNIGCDMVTPSKKDHGSCYRLEEVVADSCYQTGISPRSIKSRLRPSVGQEVAEHEHNRLPNISIEVATSSNKGPNKCHQPDRAVNSSSRTGVSTRSMTRLK